MTDDSRLEATLAAKATKKKSAIPIKPSTAKANATRSAAASLTKERAVDPVSPLFNGGADPEAEAGEYVVPGLERGLKILSAFSAREPVLGAPELSKRIGIPRTTTFRLLQTLEKLGFLEKANNDRAYRLSVAVLRLGFEYINSLELTDIAPTVLEPLRDKTGFSAHLIVRDERFVVFIAKAQTTENGYFSMKIHVGSRLPAHATVHGHVLMGNMTLDALKALYPERQLESVAPQTPTTVQELYKRVVATVELGYGVSEGFFEQGISVISAPVRDMSGKIVAAVSITIPRSEIGSIAEREALVTSVRDAALALSERLNYTRP